ncbi:hypothetical protein, partial [Aliivibrio sp. 1S128]|uniref:hypothetical protein n=1 Tax=Aliivibrio sp. 1S128 TaxID=1840085 RepID=UPI001C400E8A
VMPALCQKEVMVSHKCSECGWSDKPSHKKYYTKRGLCRPICSLCNPSLEQKVKSKFKNLPHRLVYTFFYGYGARPPVASIPYVVALFFLLMYLVPKKVITFLGEDVVLLIVWLISFVLLSYGSMRFSKLLKNRMDNKEKYSWLVLIFYMPLIIIISVWVYLSTHRY